MITVKEIAELFVRLELDLIGSFCRNLAAHEQREKDEGFSWPSWQALKLQGLEKYRRENRQIFDKAFPRIKEETRQLLKEQYAQGYGMAEEGGLEAAPEPDIPSGSFFGANNRRLDRLIHDMTAGEENIKTAALRMMDDKYRATVARAQLAMAAGTKTLSQAIDMASRDFLSAGINSIVYRDGRRMNITSYAEMALRTAATRAKLQGEARRRRDLGIDTVAVSQYHQCSDTCLPWQGRVYIDDVFTDFEGEINAAGSFGKSVDGDWYMLLSKAVKGGLFHPNCRHTLTTWQKGISEKPEPLEFAPIEKAYKMEQTHRALERGIRKWKRLEEGCQDPENKAFYHQKARQAQKELREYIAKLNRENEREALRGSPWRERTFGAPEVSGRFTSESENGILKRGAEIPDSPIAGTAILSVESFNFDDNKQIAQAFWNFRRKYKDAENEYAFVLSPKERKFVLKGETYNVDVDLVGLDNLEGAVVIHNHPVIDGFSDAFSKEDFAGMFRARTKEEWLIAGDRVFRMSFHGHWLSEDEAYELYEKAKFQAREDAFESELDIAYEQLMTMRKLKQMLEGLEFNEL